MHGFDITAQAATAKAEDEGTVVHIHGLDDTPAYYTDDAGNEVPVTITVAGAHSSRFRRVEEDQRKRKLKRNQFTGQSIFDDNIEKMAACTLAWDRFIHQGKPLPCTQQNAAQLYRLLPWIYEQVLEAAHDHARFFQTGSNQPASISDSEPV